MKAAARSRDRRLLSAYLLALLVLLPGLAGAQDMASSSAIPNICYPTPGTIGPNNVPAMDPIVISGTPVAVVGAIPGLCVSYAMLELQTIVSVPLTSCTLFDTYILPVAFNDLTMPIAGSTLQTDLNFINPAATGKSDVSDFHAPIQFPSGLVQPGYFAARFRGYLRVPQAWVNHTVHFGFVEGDAVQLTLFDKNEHAYLIINRPQPLGPTALGRVTQGVEFTSAGLFPLEIDYLYVDSSSPKSLEGAVLAPPGMFVGPDYQEFATGPHTLYNQADPSDPSNFTLLSPDMFVQSDAGFRMDPNSCSQCYRASATAPGNNGPYCNLAGIVDGISCQDNAHCSGNSCNCCAPGTQCLDNGGTWICAGCLTDADCTNPSSPNYNATNSFCDPTTQQCVSQVPAADTTSNDHDCSDQHLDCPSQSPNKPYCLAGDACAQCRNDLDCQQNGLLGNYCLSGQCVVCNTDLRCGPLCHSCSGSTPFCFPEGTASFCVRCVEDSQCPGGACVAGQCAVKCATDKSCQSPYTCDQSHQACANGSVYQSSDTAKCTNAAYAYGVQCVQCYTDAQCPCGGSCTNNVCNGGCQDTTQCNGDQCCDTTSGQCYAGSCDSPGAAPCCEAAPLGAAPVPGFAAPTKGERRQALARSLLMGLLALGLLSSIAHLRRRRALRSAQTRPGPSVTSAGRT